MKKHLLPRYRKFYKANMHYRTICSDGTVMPEESKRLYKEKGCSTLAYTDHEIMLLHMELCDEEFLPIIGIEITIDDGRWSLYTKTYHLNIYSPEIKVLHIDNAKAAPEGRNSCFRLEATKKNGCHAVTRAYFLDEFGLI